MGAAAVELADRLGDHRSRIQHWLNCDPERLEQDEEEAEVISVCAAVCVCGRSCLYASWQCLAWLLLAVFDSDSGSGAGSGSDAGCPHRRWAWRRTARFCCGCEMTARPLMHASFLSIPCTVYPWLFQRERRARMHRLSLHAPYVYFSGNHNRFSAFCGVAARRITTTALHPLTSRRCERLLPVRYCALPPP